MRVTFKKAQGAQLHKEATSTPQQDPPTINYSDLSTIQLTSPVGPSTNIESASAPEGSRASSESASTPQGSHAHTESASTSQGSRANIESASTPQGSRASSESAPLGYIAEAGVIAKTSRGRGYSKPQQLQTEIAVRVAKDSNSTKIDYKPS